jgi:hypothetical protein
MCQFIGRRSAVPIIPKFSASFSFEFDGVADFGDHFLWLEVQAGVVGCGPGGDAVGYAGATDWAGAAERGKRMAEKTRLVVTVATFEPDPDDDLPAPLPEKL